MVLASTAKRGLAAGSGLEWGRCLGQAGLNQIQLFVTRLNLNDQSAVSGLCLIDPAGVAFG
jgi:hypothetical protein